MFNLFKKKSRYPQEKGITFVHHYPEKGNLGDLLCSPRHYIDFTPAQKGLHIIGGGVYKDFGVKSLKKKGIPISKSVLWGVGQSLRNLEESIEMVEQLPYLHWGIRDSDFLKSDDHYLPCVSCLHTMLNYSLGESCLLFLNADPNVIGKDGVNTLTNFANSMNWDLLFNNCSEPDFKHKLQSANRIITNSYHGTYWGLLSGRQVCSIGYSTKFRSLLFNFGFGEKHLNKILRGDTNSLIEALRIIEEKQSYISLEDSKKVLKDFRQKNISFAQKLKENKILTDFSLKYKL